MRTITRKTVVPEEIIEAHEEEETAYGCDLCDFESAEEEEVKVHHGQTHAAREIKELWGRRFVRFETEEDMESWAEAQCYSAYGSGQYDKAETKWSGPGWYAVSGESARCSRGCCTDYVLCFEPAEEWLSDLESEIARKERMLENIRSELLPEEGGKEG